MATRINVRCVKMNRIINLSIVLKQTIEPVGCNWTRVVKSIDCLTDPDCVFQVLSQYPLYIHIQNRSHWVCPTNSTSTMTSLSWRLTLPLCTLRRIFPVAISGYVQPLDEYVSFIHKANSRKWCQSVFDISSDALTADSPELTMTSFWCSLYCQTNCRK